MVTHQRYFGKKFTFTYDSHKEYANIIRMYLLITSLEEFIEVLNSTGVNYSVETDK